jgi:type VI secretion system protein ImpC
MPRLLLRQPYGARTSAIESFEFEEMPGLPTHDDYLWGNPALACLAIAAGEDAGNPELSGLPLHTYHEEGEWKSTPCAEALISESEVQALIELGMIPLVSYRGSDRVNVAGLRAINGSPLPFR